MAGNRGGRAMKRLIIGSMLGTLLTCSTVVADDVHVTIDVKPGNTPTTIEPNSRGMLPVAILTTRVFDATTVDPATILIGPTGTEAEPFRTMQEDVNRDGRTDLLILVRYQDLKVKCDTTIIRLTGKTTKGVSIEGSEKVTAEGC
jgi:hypothetical protein